MKKLHFASYLILSLALASCEPNAQELIKNDARVIFITLDGVRWQEFFGTPDQNSLPGGSPLKRFWAEIADRGIVIGAPATSSRITTHHSSNLSMPGYRSIFGGVIHSCSTNDCSRIETETLQERIARSLRDAPREAVASFASWNRLDRVVESKEGATQVNTGVAHFPGHDDINRAQDQAGISSEKTRWDAFTWAHSMRYLKRERPRFLYIGLNDSDEFAHRNDRRLYLESLRIYDQWIAELILETLPELGSDGENTTVIITTDHGRGHNERWTDHYNVPEADRIWLFAIGAHIPQTGVSHIKRRYTHLNIRPTIEALFGLSPVSAYPPIQELTPIK